MPRRPCTRHVNPHPLKRWDDECYVPCRPNLSALRTTDKGAQTHVPCLPQGERLRSRRKRRHRIAQVPRTRRGSPRLLEEGQHLLRIRREPPRRRKRRKRIRLLRRPSLRERPAPLRPPAHRLRQGPRRTLPDSARPQGRTPLRLGHPRPARRTRGNEAARHDRQARNPRNGHRQLQRRCPRIRAQVHQRVGKVRHPPGTLGRLRKRLQDPERRVHGVRHLGVQAPLR